MQCEDGRGGGAYGGGAGGAYSGGAYGGGGGAYGGGGAGGAGGYGGGAGGAYGGAGGGGAYGGAGAGAGSGGLGFVGSRRIVSGGNSGGAYGQADYKGMVVDAGDVPAGCGCAGEGVQTGCVSVGCAQVAGPSMMTFVGTGAGDYITTTTYTYVGDGAGNLRMAQPTKVAYGRIGCLVLTLLLIAGAAIAMMMMPATTTTTMEPQKMAIAQAVTPPAEQMPMKMGECTFWGDPHIHTFDGGRPSFYGEGEFYIVKSDKITIQGRYMGTKYTKGLAATDKVVVGGSFLQGHVISVGCMQDGTPTVDGQPVLSTFPSTYKVGEIATLTYNAFGKNVDDANAKWEKHIVHMELPMNVRLTVLRWDNYLDLRLSMPAQPGQDGSCGNFDGNAENDSTQDIMSRIGFQVPQGELLFQSRAEIEITSTEEKLLRLCPPEKKNEGTAKCRAEGAAEGRTLQSCVINYCFGSNEHALKMAKQLGI